MNKMTKLLLIMGIVSMTTTVATAQTIVDYYSLTMSLKVPQVIDNMSSMGK